MRYPYRLKPKARNRIQASKELIDPLIDHDEEIGGDRLIYDPGLTDREDDLPEE